MSRPVSVPVKYDAVPPVPPTSVDRTPVQSQALCLERAKAMVYGALDGGSDAFDLWTKDELRDLTDAEQCEVVALFKTLRGLCLDAARRSLAAVAPPAFPSGRLVQEYEETRAARPATSAYYCGICGTRTRGRHKKEMHLVKDPPCNASCGNTVPGRVPRGAECEECDPKGKTRRWRQPKDAPLP